MNLNHFYEIFPPGYTFTISHTPKRDDGEWRDRWTWQLIPSSNIGKRIHVSRWFGFQSMKEALEDLTTYLESYYYSLRLEVEDEPEEEIDVSVILNDIYKLDVK